MKIVNFAAAIVLLGSCAADENRPVVCDNYDAVRASADDLRNANISENGLSQVRTNLQALRSDLTDLLEEARTTYQAQVDVIQLAAQDLATAVTAARSDPGPMTLAAVGDAAAWLRETVHRLGTAMADTC